MYNHQTIRQWTFRLDVTGPFSAATYFVLTACLFAAMDTQTAFGAEQASTLNGGLQGPVNGPEGEFPCTQTFANGAEVQVTTCDGLAESEFCCDASAFADDADVCAVSCLCTFEESRSQTQTSTIAEHEVLLRGVPMFSQFKTQPDTDTHPIGCGPIAIVELLTWYGAWGWTELVSPYIDRHERINWVDMAWDAADAADTYFFKKASPTLPRNMKPAIEQLVDAAGYRVHVDHRKVWDNEDELAENFERIKTSIQQGRPVIIGFDIDETPGGGIGGGGDNLGFIDHYGVIVGYDIRDGIPGIYVNQGAGRSVFDGSDYTGLEYFEWDIGSGRVHLYFVALDASEKTRINGAIDEECPIDIYQERYATDTEGVSFGVTGGGADELPLISTLIAETDCSVVGGTETETITRDYTITRTEGLDCSARYAVYDDPNALLAGEQDNMHLDGLEQDASPVRH